jgi:hypothetical protein
MEDVLLVLLLTVREQIRQHIKEVSGRQNHKKTTAVKSIALVYTPQTNRQKEI